MPEFSNHQLIEDIAQALSPEQFDEGASRWLTVVDDLNTTLIELKDVHLACRAGCSICCSLRIDVFAHEVFLLARFIRRHYSAEEIQALQERLAAHEAKVLPLSVFEHATRNIPCPVLLSDGRCGAYEARPQSCRRHHSQDLATCQYTYDHPDDLESPSAHDRGLYRALTGAMQLNVDAYFDLGFDCTIYELGTALAEALRDPAAWDRWVAKEQAFLHASVTPSA
jgi:Fe-S-cluster containining protein